MSHGEDPNRGLGACQEDTGKPLLLIGLAKRWCGLCGLSHVRLQESGPTMDGQGDLTAVACVMNLHRFRYQQP